MRLLLLFLFTPLFLCSQTQIGYDIDGLVAGDNAGYSVSISTNGSIVAVGSPNNNADRTGEVRIFENNSGEWIQIGDAIEGESVGDEFGSSVSLSGDGSIIVIGAPYNDNEESDSGNARVFENISGVWTQIGEDINGINSGDRMGMFVNLSDDGSKLAIAGYWCCGKFHGTPGEGKTYIYEYIIDEWYVISEELSTGFNGISDIELSADGTVVAISSSGGGSPGWSNFYSGGVIVYKNISGIWTQIGDPFFREISWWSYDYFGGVSLTNDGSKIAIGGFATGVYKNIANEWIQLGEDIEGGDFTPKLSISDNGNILVIGGSVTRLYENNSGNWGQLGIDINAEATNDYFGASIELSGDGTTLIIGAPNNNGNGEDAGHARVYDLSALLSLEELNVFDVKLFPNPATNQFVIELPESQILEKVNIYNNLGQFIQSNDTHHIQTSHLASGLYYVELITNLGKATKKLILD